MSKEPYYLANAKETYSTGIKGLLTLAYLNVAKLVDLLDDGPNDELEILECQCPSAFII